jgi:NCS2 family nucleobase:cation symporter-2
MDFKSIFWSKERDDETPFELDGKPSLKVALPLALQHILAMFVGNIAPITILVTVAGGAMGLDLSDKIFLVQMAMFASGIATLIQLYPLGKIGARLPIVMGTSFSFLGVAILVGFEHGIAGVFGAALVGSVVEIALGFTMPYIRKYFTPLITGIVVLGIGFSLLDVGADYVAGGSAAKFAGEYGQWENLLV